jgi:ornithine carbamoyltransferase
MKIEAPVAVTSTHPRDLLRISDLTSGELTCLLDLAGAMKADPHRWRAEHDGKAVGCYFAKPSTRTRVSFETAAWRLGMLQINVPNSLMQAGALTGMTIRVASPAGYEPDRNVVAGAQGLAATSGGSIEVTNEPLAAVEGADAVYTDVWVSMGEEAEQAERLERLRAYQVNGALMSRASKHAVFLHCLPAHRGEEVADGVIDGSRSIVFEQAGNRLPTQQAVLHTLLSGAWDAA